MNYEFNTDNVGDIFFTSDLHLRHANIIKYCLRPLIPSNEIVQGLIRQMSKVNLYDVKNTFNMDGFYNLIEKIFTYEDVYEHDNIIIDNWNERVRDNSVIFLLGDVSMPYFEDVNVALKKLKGKKYLIMGNHDVKNEFIDYSLFEDVQDSMTISINDRIYTLNHTPLDDWEGKDEGHIHLYGHYHGSMKAYHKNALEVSIDAIADYKKDYNIGYRGYWHYSPISWTEIDGIKDFAWKNFSQNTSS